MRDSDGNVETIRTTDEHPFFVAGIGWLRAADLSAGMRLNEADDSNDALVVSSVREEHPEGIDVYNLEVAGDHTYFVEDGLGEATAVWVHNFCQIRTTSTTAAGQRITQEAFAVVRPGDIGTGTRASLAGRLWARLIGNPAPRMHRT